MDELGLIPSPTVFTAHDSIALAPYSWRATTRGLLHYQRANHSHFASEINGLAAGFRMLSSDAIYLACIDCRDLKMDA